ncbi:DUF7455 domain-containing protein [Nocardiopsis ansamitocini]|uniref:DUF7455 domain-containing protein n=1 Tax=Nocardiopsis ansamitocini TaxID=1670832 RepID=A0A9W6UJ22_9ACTN|nr:hypothetical protein [Nocardiopsis ansamitocini]GLU48048.1 hypothetical protein Nans01_23990 [Nocardiopsis ansamitocini]
MTGTLAPTQPLTAADRCDRCGAQAYVRVVLSSGGELLFCAHHMRKHDDSIRKIASEIQDETDRLHSTKADVAEDDR